MLKDCFDRVRNRDTQLVSAADIVEMHGTFAETFSFNVPLHPKNLSQLIHPHWGYMASMTGLGYSWDDMLQMYEHQMIASYEKSKGRTIHAEEISALSFWLLHDKERTGILEEQAMLDLFHGLRFPNLRNWADFRQEFAFSIEQGEMDRNNRKMLRFDLMRQIFLHRGL